ncbi:bacteriohemerythrin [Thermovenabulum gondwanense]|uniref:Bacteriohemerythrin n=1 Tax=Thermovenabulum gondwanense TaxID=520767 RepID=A0A162N0I5_9FIRM|nr:hemerythrin family protein [Thermovenabulum gondwanense]KYO68634.1 Bacteriohemerythrin [Thermovenabulum gondwanense]
MIKWKDDYKVGIYEIDNQHRRLFEIAEDTYNLLKNEFILDKYDKIIELISELKDYAKYHFKSEEEYMEKIGYKRLLSHKVEHKDFIEKIDSIDIFKIDQNQEAYVTELLDFIVNWISNHILEKDKKIISE